MRVCVCVRPLRFCERALVGRRFCEPGRPQDAHKRSLSRFVALSPMRVSILLCCECRSSDGNSGKAACSGSRNAHFSLGESTPLSSNAPARLLNQRLENAATLLSVRPASQPASNSIVPLPLPFCAPEHATSNWEKLSLLSS